MNNEELEAMALEGMLEDKSLNYEVIISRKIYK